MRKSILDLVRVARISRAFSTSVIFASRDAPIDDTKYAVRDSLCRVTRKLGEFDIPVGVEEEYCERSLVSLDAHLAGGAHTLWLNLMRGADA